MKDYSLAVSKEIRVLMIRKDIDQMALAERSGLTQPTISRRLAGKSPWPVDDLQDVSEALGVPLLDLIAAAEKLWCAAKDSNLQPAEYAPGAVISIFAARSLRRASQLPVRAAA